MQDTLRDGAHTAAGSDTFEALARGGWVVKGVVHGMIGVLALLWAIGERNGETTDPQGAIGAIGSGPLAMVLVGIIVVGVFAYALWRFAQAVLDLDGDGDDAKGLAKRAVYFGIGVAYVVLGLTAAGALLAGGDGPDGEADFSRWTAFALALPAGAWLVAAAGIGTGIAALVFFYRAYTAPFLEYWRKDENEQVVHRVGAALGRFGLAARGVVFAVVGWYLFRAGRGENAEEARNLGEALSALSPEPWLLMIVAVGLIAFGLFCFANARYRHINGDADAIDGG